MITSWTGGLARHRTGRLVAAVAGIALAVALVAALGSFLTASKATMTQRAVRSVAVAWQVEVQPGADPNAVLSLVRKAPGTGAAFPVGFDRTTGFTARVQGSTQTTGPGMVLGLPAGYRAQFPDEIRPLSGASTGVLLAQQTASNLHAAPGDTVGIQLPGVGVRQVRVDGVVDLPQADSLFQKVGAPAQSQPTAPPDNVVLLPAASFDSLTHGAPNVITQIHVARDANLPSDPAAAFTSATGTAHNLEAKSAGAALVGNNLGAALDSARQDALYAQILFLFLGVPGALLAAALTAAVASAGGQRRRQEQGLLRLRGLSPRQITGLAGLEAAIVAVGGGLAGLAIAALTGRLAFGAVSFGASTGAWALWYVLAFVLGAAVAAGAVLVPALRDLRSVTVADTRKEAGVLRSRSPWWMRYGVDFALLIGSWLVFRASSGNQYALVLAPEGVPTLSVSYWAFLGPALLWIGAALLVWRVTLLALAHGRPALARLARPFTATLAGTTAAVMSRRRRPLARSVVLLALAVSFAISTAVFNSTYRQQAEVDARLTNGADVTVTEPLAPTFPRAREARCGSPAYPTSSPSSTASPTSAPICRTSTVSAPSPSHGPPRSRTPTSPAAPPVSSCSGSPNVPTICSSARKPSRTSSSLPATPSTSASRTPVPRHCARCRSTTPASSRNSRPRRRTASSSPTPPTWPRRPAATRLARFSSTPAAPTRSRSPHNCVPGLAPAPPSPT